MVNVLPDPVAGNGNMLARLLVSAALTYAG
jgi:hypothetical protein